MDKRIHKHKSDYGMSDYYKFYTKKYNKDIPKKLFNSIITDFNKGIVDLIIEKGLIYSMPGIFFEICIRKDKRAPRLVNGKLVNNVPIDWKTTNELWAKDSEAKEKKLLVRFNNSHTAGFVFRIFCKKFKSKLKYKSLYKFAPNRKFQRALSARIKDENKDPFDAFLFFNRD